MADDPRTPIFTFLAPYLKDGWNSPGLIQGFNAELDKLGAPKVEASAPSPPFATPFDPSTYGRAAMIAELRRDEGERRRAYKDTVGKWTIGVGRNLDDVGTEPLGRTVADVKANGITEAESALMLAHDLNRVDADLDRKLSWWRNLDPVRQRIMVNMCFNLGIGGLLGFHNTLAMIEGHRYTEAAQNMLASKWARQVGDRAKRLSAMMRTGAA